MSTVTVEQRYKQKGSHRIPRSLRSTEVVPVKPLGDTKLRFLLPLDRHLAKGVSETIMYPVK